MIGRLPPVSEFLVILPLSSLPLSPNLSFPPTDALHAYTFAPQAPNAERWVLPLTDPDLNAVSPFGFVIVPSAPFFSNLTGAPRRPRFGAFPVVRLSLVNIPFLKP